MLCRLSRIFQRILLCEPLVHSFMSGQCLSPREALAAVATLEGLGVAVARSDLEGRLGLTLSGDVEVHEIQPLPQSSEVLVDAWLVRDHGLGVDYEVWQTAAQSGVYRVAHEAATVIATRLPAPGARNVLHLVSLEGRYVADTTVAGGRRFDPHGATGSQKIRLVSLANWSFFCREPGRDFAGLLEGLNATPSATSPEWGLPIPPSAAAGSDASRFLRAGYLPLRHRARQGDRTVSWYHGPLVRSVPDVAAAVSGRWRDDNGTLTVRSADELLLFDDERGMLDVSYAAAWSSVGS